MDKPLHNLVPSPSSVELAVVLALTYQGAPISTALAIALQVVGPAGEGPTVKDVPAAGQFVYTTDVQCRKALLRARCAGRIAGIRLDEKDWGGHRFLFDAYPRRYHCTALAA